MNTSDLPSPSRLVRGWIVAAIIVALAIAHVLIAGLAARTKSPTFDEPMHALGAIAAWHLGDFRINPEDPPLWRYWAALCVGKSEVVIDQTSSAWNEIPAAFDRQFRFVHKTWFASPANRPLETIGRMRWMMSILGGALVLAAAWLARELIGASGGNASSLAALIVAAMVAFEPNLLGHSPLIKNDVAQTLCFVLLMIGLIRVCRRVSAGGVVLVFLSAAVWTTTKFTGLLALPIVSMVLVGRALLPGVWLGRGTSTRFRRLLLTGGIAVLCGSTMWLGIWAAYGFRFAATPDPDVRLNFDQFLIEARLHQANRAGVKLTPAQAILSPDDTFAAPLGRAYEGQLAPEAYLVGLAQLHARSIDRPAYLLGKAGPASAAYFPLAIAFKSPVGLLLLLGGGGVCGLYFARSALRRTTSHEPIGAMLIALIVPPAVYTLVAAAGGLNLGIRHIFPAYVAVLVIAVCLMMRMRTPIVRWIAAGLIGLSAIESLGRYPSFISFFNVGAGGPTQGIDLLGDSNLDWGQDLPLLADWQKHNPGRPMLLSYFGTADPAVYTIAYTNIPPGYPFATSMELLTPELVDAHPGAVIAISASWLQSMYRPDLLPMIRSIRAGQPIARIGETIYVYDAADWAARVRGK